MMTAVQPLGTATRFGRRWLVPYLTALLASSSCSAEPETTPTPVPLDSDSGSLFSDGTTTELLVSDTVVGTDAGPDQSWLDAGPVAPGSFSAPCNGNNDCDSGYCVDGPNGYVCSQICQADCPSGWDCKAISSTGSDTVFVCLPRQERLCTPCASDLTCIGGACLLIDGGGRCAAVCEADADCDNGYACLDATASGKTGKFCQPTSGSCTCNDKTAGDKRTCTADNTLGSCYGLQTCDPASGWSACTAVAPATEVCNGVDDDCNALVDDLSGIGGTCSKTNAAGSCSGILACTPSSPELVCLAQQPTAETCNGVDDDCDGGTDEQAPAPLCPKQNGVCAGSEASCAGTAGFLACSLGEYGPSYQAVELSCDGLDNDCDGQTDEDLPANLCPSQMGACAGSFRSCGGTAGWSDCGAAQYGLAYQASETSCDNVDNDCDGQTDEAFVDPVSAKYAADTACGNCFTDCTQIYAKDNAFGLCNSSAVPVCEMVCKPGAFDLNQVVSDGCEFLLDPQAIYVSQSDATADNAAGCGRGPVGTGEGNRPCVSIAQGIAEALADGRSKVLIADGLYNEPIVVVNGISLTGGHRADTWERNGLTSLTIVRGKASDGPHERVLLAAGIDQPTVVEGLVIDAATNNQVGGNNYAVYVTGGSSGLVLRQNVIYAGDGGPGSDQTSATNGLGGVDGAGRLASGTDSAYDGKDATGAGECNTKNNRQYDNGGQRQCGATDVSGGNGGGNQCSPIYNQEASAIDGITGKGTGGGSGGDAGDDSDQDTDFFDAPICYIPATAQEGKSGANGEEGTNGSAGSGCAATTGTIVGGHWVGNSGLAGTGGDHGSGGGGGGAGGGAACAFGCNKARLGGHGGGGGSGGCAGEAGSGGGAGGGSFGVFVADDSVPILQDNVIFAGSGGDGGNGGNGGVGGSGGSGGNGGGCLGNCFCSNPAGKGGEGGSGGHGGGGGGGCGGASYGIFRAGSSASGYCSGNGNQVAIGSGGSAGAGGLSLGAGGTPGSSGEANACN
jgi:hypothetical protein